MLKDFRISWKDIRKATGLAISLLICCAVAAKAHGAVVLVKGSSQPRMGYLVRRDERLIVLREELDAGKTRETLIPRGDIDELIITVSPERLAALDPAQPHLYWEYAEELAEKRRDPEARDAAIRLYAIAAAHGDGKLRRGAFLGLISLARSPQEERRLRAAAYLFDPQHDAAVLTGAPRLAPTPVSAASPAQSELLEAIRFARQGKGAQAKAILGRPAVRAQLKDIAATITEEELLAATASNLVTREQLRKLVQAELALEGMPSPPSSVDDSRRFASWSQAVKLGGLAPLPLLDLKTLTEFDPSACLFRDRKWVRP